MCKIFKISIRLVFISLLLLLFFVCWRVLVADRFIVPSNSMYPTLQQGDRVLVNKLIFGARIYNNLDSIKNGKLTCWRTRGMREIKHNDILVFNFPKKDDKLFFKMNYVFVKRCIALPGDSISTINSFYKNNNFSELLGNIENQTILNATDLDMLDASVKYCQKSNNNDSCHTIKNFGPLYVPRRGDIKQFTKNNILPYKSAIEYETGVNINSLFNTVSDTVTYCFKQNYYFMAGDNVLDSGDSRYWGFVPEDYIVGVVYAVLFNKNKQTGEISFNNSRIFKNGK